MKRCLFFLVVSVTVLVTACGGSTEIATKIPVTVAQATAEGWQREEEPCSNRRLLPDFYVDVPFEELGGGVCAFYYSPDKIYYPPAK